MIVAIGILVGMTYVGLCCWLIASNVQKCGKSLELFRVSENKTGKQLESVKDEVYNLYRLSVKLGEQLEQQKQEPCKFAHMQSVHIPHQNTHPVCSPMNNSKEFIYLYHKSDGRFEGSRAIGHPDIASGHYDAKWPNGEMVQCLTS